ncbi:MAG: SAM-dependent methyltransferase [Oscillospiraceae bacterium]|nr:SAM-dependent methyltransferase [Oscillospiraceae bacterium]
MKIPLSRRLEVCAGFVAPGDRVADIGCDHGYLSIYLLKNGIASHAYASDINEGPLQSALHNAHKFGVADRMQLYLSDGVRKIPRDFDTLICAGMGGDTMVHILESAPWLRSAQYRLILQCQSKTPLLRQYLSEQGWRITEETAVKDGKFIYTVMEVYFEPGYPKLTVGQWYFPPALLENPGKDTVAYYKWVVEGLKIATAHKEDPEKQQALAELFALADDENLRFLKEA